MKLITWDYDKKLITEWLRLGSCNRCGECCDIMVTIGTVGKDDDDRRNGGDGTDRTGVWHQWDNGKPRYWKVEQIDHDTPENCFERCEGQCVNGWENKKLICQAWPLHPDHVNEFNNCSYHFVKLNEWEMSEDDLEEGLEKEEIIE